MKEFSNKKKKEKKFKAGKFSDSKRLELRGRIY